MAVAMYYVEQAIWIVCTLSTWIMLAALLLSARFTPRKRVPDAKLAMLLIGFTSVCLNAIRCVDLNAIFGLIDFSGLQFIHNVVTALHLFCVCIYIRSLARTLYMQLQAPVPPGYAYSMFGANTIYFVSAFFTNPAAILLKSKDLDALRDTLGGPIESKLNLINGIKGLFFDFTVGIIVCVMIILFVRLYVRLTKFIQTLDSQHKRTESNKLSPLNRTNSIAPSATKGHVSIRVQVEASEAPSASSPTDMDTTTPGDPNRRLLAPNAEGGGHRGSESGATSPVPAGGEPSATAASPAHGGRRANNSVSPAPMQQPIQTSHEQRVADLKGAVRTLTILSLAVIILGIFCLAFDMTGSAPSLAGSKISYGTSDYYHIFGPNPDSWSATFNLMPWVQQINMFLVCWYCWSPAGLLFLAKYRREKNIGFWDGLMHGVDGGADTKGSRYDATSKVDKPSAVRQQTFHTKKPSSTAVAPASNVEGTPKKATNAWGATAEGESTKPTPVAPIELAPTTTAASPEPMSPAIPEEENSVSSK